MLNSDDYALYDVKDQMKLKSPSFFFLNDTAPPEIYPLPLHDALPICASCTSALPPFSEQNCFGTELPAASRVREASRVPSPAARTTAHVRLARLIVRAPASARDRKSTRLNSSHSQISYAVFCLKKKKT